MAIRGPVSSAETETYRQVWGLNGYGDYSPGERFASIFVDMVQAHDARYLLPKGVRTATVLDAGTGTGKGALALQAAGFDVTACDLTAEGLIDAAKDLPFHEVCLWGDLQAVVGRHDWVVNCDVLEHLPTPFVMLTVHRLLEVAREGVFLSIALVPDAFGAWLGKSLHQTVQPFDVWKTQLGELADVVEARDLLMTGVFLLKARR